MMRMMTPLTLVACLVAVAASTAVAQPGSDQLPSVLAPGYGPQQPMEPMGPMGPIPMDQGGYYPQEGGYSGTCDRCMGYGCDQCDTWAFGPRRPQICGGWGKFDLLLWWNKGRHVPALLTTSDPADAGILGRPTTEILFGDSHIGSDLQAGGRLDVGVWMNPSQTSGVGFRFLALEGDETIFTAVSDGSTVLARPFLNASTGLENAILIGLPGSNSGDASIRATNDFLNTEVYGRFHMHGDHASRIDLLAGYHFARIDDSLEIASRTTIIDPLSPLQGVRFDVFDNFATENEFHGALIGLAGERTNGCARVSWLGKISAGSMRQESIIAGNTVVNNGVSIPVPGGLFAQGTNSGTQSSNRFAFIPEFDLNLHYRVTPWADVSVGYSIMWFSSVAFAGDQIDRRVNLTQQPGPIVGPALPAEKFEVTDFWVQGINFGMNFTF